MRPMWRWQPTILRRIALVVYLPCALALMLFWAVLRAAFSAFMQFVWELAEGWPGRNGWRGGRAWTVATWRGEHVGEALVAEMERF